SFRVQGNKVKNGSFQQSATGTTPDNWTSSGSTSYQPSGTASAGPGGSWTSDPVAVDPGASYQASVTASGAQGTMLVQQLDGPGRVVASTTQALVPLSVATLSSVGVTAVPSAAAVRVVLLGGLTGTTTFDDVA